MRYLCAGLLLCGLAFAQDVPRAEVFLGYSYINADTNGLTSRLSMNGGDASFVVNFNRSVGAETNFSGYFKHLNIADVGVSLRDFNILFGPRLHYKWTFAHVLVGLDDFGGSALGGSSTNGAVGGAVGGGGAFMISRHIGVEAGGDYLFTRHNLEGGSAVTQNHGRALAGFVFTFGGSTNSEDQVPVPAADHSSRPASVRTSTPRSAQAGMKLDLLGATVTLGQNSGAEIIDEAPNGAAAIAGMHLGDVINLINGESVKSPMELAAELAKQPDGEKIRIGFLIRGTWQTEVVVLITH
jgi:hypothetical protein